jgi:sucrose synthase
LQIVVDKKSGFSIDPYHGSEAAEKMANFFEESAKNPDSWLEVSRGSLARVQEKCALSFTLFVVICSGSGMNIT